MTCRVIFFLDNQNEISECHKLARSHQSQSRRRQNRTCIAQGNCLHFLEPNEWQQQFQNIMNLLISVYPELGHTIVSFRQISDSKLCPYPDERLRVSSILIETNCRHEAQMRSAIFSFLNLKHQAPIAIKKSGDVGAISFRSTSHGITCQRILVLKRIIPQRTECVDNSWTKTMRRLHRYKPSFQYESLRTVAISY